METRRIGFRPDALLEPREALTRYFSCVQLARPAIERVCLHAALGRILAQEICADADYPAAARSAMDGFAVPAAQTPGRFRIAGTIGIAQPWPRPLEAGWTLRIPTGGVVPQGADAVVPVEDADVAGEFVTVPAAPAGDCVTPAASDMRAGDRILAAGKRLRPADIALLATLGYAEAEVFAKPRIGVLSSGDELVPVDAPVRPGQIRDSNRYGIAASLELCGAHAVHLPTVADEPGLLEAALRNGLESCDAVVLTGGSSVGERDLTPEIVAKLGHPGVVVHGLRVKPGKPTVLGAAGVKPVIGLPGNPTSALTILEMVARPIVERLVGSTDEPAMEDAVLGAPVRKRAGWTWYVPARLDQAQGGTLAYPLELRSSSVSLLARAAAVIELGEACESLEAGAAVKVRRL